VTQETQRYRLLRRLGKALFVTVGVVAILLAVALGVFRLLIAQIPDYQNELKAWVADELGLEVDFEMLDARLGLRGPELSLRSASIGGSDGIRFLLAEEAAITLDPVALVVGRRIEISRLTLGGVELTVERDANGTFSIGDFDFEPGEGELAAWVPESVEVVIRDSKLRYADAVSAEVWEFDDLFVSVESTDERLEGNATMRPPADLAGSLELVLEAGLDAGGSGNRWQVDAMAGGLDLGILARIVPIAGMPAIAGRGEVDARLKWNERSLDAVEVGVDFEDFSFGTTAGNEFEHLGLVADWERLDASQWHIGLSNIAVTRADASWAPAAEAGFSLTTDEDGIVAVSLDAGFVRLDDLAPFVRAFPETQLAEQWELFGPVGDIRSLGFSLERRGEVIAYDLEADFSGIAFAQVGAMPGIEGVSGHVSAGEDSGTIEFTSGPLALDWPLLFPRVLDADSLEGHVVWQQEQDAIQISSADFGVGVLGDVARASFALRLPRDGATPVLNLQAVLGEVDLVPAKDYLPVPIMPDAVVEWLEQAVQGGRGRNVELGFTGPVSSFPFDDGLGRFSVEADIEDATLVYMRDWPAAEELDGRISFVNAGFFAEGAGRVLSNVTDRAEIEIEDMRVPLLTLATRTDGPLEGVVDFLRGSPLIADHLGPDFGRLRVAGGQGAIDARVELPLNDLGDYTMDASLEIANGGLAVDGLRAPIEEIYGVIRADESAVSADDLEAVFLGGSIVATIARSERPGYRAVLAVEGETTAEAAAESFALPHQELLGGQTMWRGELLMPSLDPLATSPTRITVESNLAGVAIRFPEPLAKTPSEAMNMRLEFSFAAGNRLEVSGNLGASRRFALDFEAGDDGLAFSSGAVQFGGDEPRLPIQPGIIVGGLVESLALDEWLDVAGNTELGRAGTSFLGADLEIGEFRAFGQQLGATDLRVTRGTDAWSIDLASEAIAGEILVPSDGSDRKPIVADMSRVYLAGGADSSGLAPVDPRTLAGLRLEAEEFAVGTRQLGRVSAVVEPDPRGLVLTSLTSETENFRTELSGSWLKGPLGSRTTIDATIQSSDVQAALAELGLDPVIEGEMADVEAHVYWDGAPAADWLDHLNGDVSIFVETGTLREIDPGAGRVVGLMSIAALPRRLMLDFRDVFEEGFAFDEISGDFRVVDGNAYTNNLKFGGPAAEIGVVGRTGLRDRDYRQQIVVTAEPGNMLPTVGGLLGGAGVGAALFVFTRLFKEPLKGIGRASYCLTGSWEEPAIEPIEDDESDQALSCAELPRTMLEEIRDE